MSQPDAWQMIRRRAAAAGIAEAIGCQNSEPEPTRADFEHLIARLYLIW